VSRPERHPSSENFHRLLEECGELHDRKQRDYGTDADPFANVRAGAQFGVPAWVAAAIRMADKLRRLQTFATKGELANESAEDAFKDLAVYALIGLCLYREDSSLAGEVWETPVKPAPFCDSSNGASMCRLIAGHPGKHANSFREWT
jgi:hypothetical protein